MNHCHLGPKRCAACKNQRYGYEHQQERRLWEHIVLAGNATCSRCGEPITPGAAWDLDHIGSQRWPAHAAHNRAARDVPTTLSGHAASRAW